MYSIEFRRAILKLYQYFNSMRKVSKCMNVSIASISRWNNRLEPKTRIRIKSKTSEALRAFVVHLAVSKVCLTCKQISTIVATDFGFSISRQLVHVILKSSNVSFKRIRTRGISKTKESKTQEFLKNYNDIHQDTLVVSIDESGFNQKSHCTYGYAFKGTKAIVNHATSKESRHVSLLLSISNKGDKYFLLTDDNVNGDCFAAFIKKLPYPSNTILLLDNCSIHKTKMVKEVAMLKGYILMFIPPYSPEFNPIELVFGFIKNKYYRSRLEEGSLKIIDVVNSITSKISKYLIKNCFDHVLKTFIKPFKNK